MSSSGARRRGTFAECLLQPCITTYLLSLSITRPTFAGLFVWHNMHVRAHVRDSLTLSQPPGSLGAINAIAFQNYAITRLTVFGMFTKMIHANTSVHLFTFRHILSGVASIIFLYLYTSPYFSLGSPRRAQKSDGEKVTYLAPLSPLAASQVLPCLACNSEHVAIHNVTSVKRR